MARGEEGGAGAHDTRRRFQRTGLLHLCDHLDRRYGKKRSNIRKPDWPENLVLLLFNAAFILYRARE